MRLPDGKTAILYSVYEAVSNSIHAINDKFGEAQAAAKGRVAVDIAVDNEGNVEQISITDNGIGFTPDNLESFETSDSQFKYQRGGKGVGRFIWIKIFESILIDSVAKVERKTERIRFQFAPEKSNSIAEKRVTQLPGATTGTTITLSSIRPEQRGHLRQLTFLKDLALHFFPQYLAGTLPQVDITYKDNTDSLNDFISTQVEEPFEEVLDVNFGEKVEQIKVTHLYVNSSISTGLRNSYLLTAHGRLVGEPISIERKYALKQLPDGKAYVAVVSSDFLDQQVDQERLGFKITAEQYEVLEVNILGAAEQFLKDHIGKVRGEQKKTIQNLIQEHPQLATQITNVDEYVEGLFPGMDDEQIGQNLFVLLYREEKELRKRIEEFDQLVDLNPEAVAQAHATLEEVSNQQKHRLAELVVKRHQVLQIAEN